MIPKLEESREPRAQFQCLRAMGLIKIGYVFREITTLGSDWWIVLSESKPSGSTFVLLLLLFCFPLKSRFIGTKQAKRLGEVHFGVASRISKQKDPS